MKANFEFFGKMRLNLEQDAVHKISFIFKKKLNRRLKEKRRKEEEERKADMIEMARKEKKMAEMLQNAKSRKDGVESKKNPHLSQQDLISSKLNLRNKYEANSSPLFDHRKSVNQRRTMVSKPLAFNGQRKSNTKEKLALKLNTSSLQK